jgi:iron complex transport system substrate-binding protein
MVIALLALLALVATACGDDGGSEDSDESTDTTEAAADTSDGEDEMSEDAAWPVEIEHVYGTTTIEQEPASIASASVSMTGHLLAVDAPVVASMTTSPDSPLADENGFFIQWANIAVDDDIEAIAGPGINFEAIAASNPDLIIGSAVGADAVSQEAYGLLSDIAPTIVLDHSASSWQDLTTLLGEATGNEDEAVEVLNTFDGLTADVAETTDPTYEVTALVYNPDGMNVFTAESAHGQLLESLGYAIHALPEGSSADSSNEGRGRSDIVAVSLENASNAFGDSTLFFVFDDQASVDAYGAENPVLAALPAFQDERAIALGPSSFRLDYFSATDVVELIGQLSEG